ncbi:MAG: sigma-54 dependent transcriptional regulator [Sedimenticola sp.]
MTQCDDVKQVLLVDDESEVRASIAQTLELEGFEVTSLSGAAAALEQISYAWPGIVLSDLKMPRMDGLTFLSKVMEIDAELPFVIVSAHGDIPMTVQAMRDGAYEFLEKTADPEQLITVVRRAMDKRSLVLENRTLRREVDAQGELERRIIGKSPPMEALRNLVSSLSETDADILIYGETGTGKELVARCLHDFSLRKAEPFVALNCGALPEDTIVSELFGHEVGAFTCASDRRIGKIEYAKGGTLFLDEIESMPPRLQVMFLRVLEERTIERMGSNKQISVNIRVITASKIDLLAASQERPFREDLFYRLDQVRVELPPLRKCGKDVLLLFGHFVDLAAKRYKKTNLQIGTSVQEQLVLHSWPGNVRELRNVADRYVLGMPLFPDQTPIAETELAQPLSTRMEQFEKQTICEVLRRNQGQIIQTAEALKIPRKTLYLRMQKYGLDKKEFR